MTLNTGDRIVRIATVLKLTRLSRSTLYRKVQRGEFPKQIKLSEHRAGWRLSSVSLWMRTPDVLLRR